MADSVRNPKSTLTAKVPQECGFLADEAHSAIAKPNVKVGKVVGKI
jgi:hypothetical protein